MLRKLAIIMIFGTIVPQVVAKPQDEVVIVGQIDNALARTVQFTYKKNPFTSEISTFETVTNENSQFVAKLRLKQPTVVQMRYQNKPLRLYITPGDTLKVRFNGGQPLQTVAFDGNHPQIALHNRYMQQSLLRFPDWVDESIILNMLYSRSSADYSKYVTDIYNRKKDFLENYPQDKKELFSEVFFDYINSDVEYWRGYYLMKYYDIFGLNNTDHIINDYYFNFIFELDNMNFKALNNDYYLSYIEIFLKYWKEKSKEGQAMNESDVVEEKTKVERVVKPTTINTRILEEPFATEKVIAWLEKGEQAVFLNLQTSERFKYVGRDTMFEDTYYKIQTKDNKIGWVPSTLVQLEDRTTVVKTRRIRNCLDPNSPLCGFDQHLSGKVLYFMVAKDIMYGALNEPEATTEQRIRDFNVNNHYPEFTETLDAVFAHLKADRLTGNNRLRVPEYTDFQYHTLEAQLLNNSLYALRPATLPADTVRADANLLAEQQQRDERARVIEAAAKVERERREEKERIALQQQKADAVNELKIKEEKDKMDVIAQTVAEEQKKNQLLEAEKQRILQEKAQQEQRLVELERKFANNQTIDKVEEERLKQEKVEAEKRAKEYEESLNRLTAQQLDIKKKVDDFENIIKNKTQENEELKKLLADARKREEAAKKREEEAIIALQNQNVNANSGVPPVITTHAPAAPAPAIQMPQVNQDPNAVVFASSKPGMEINNAGNVILLDNSIYKPGEPVRFEGMLINEIVPPFSSVDINGQDVRQPDLLGKVVYIDFWATWCGPCKDHIAAMQSQIEENKNNKDIVYLFISLDNDANKWRSYVKENNLGGLHIHDPHRLMSMYWNIQALPNYFLLGKDGRVAINSFIKSKKSLEDMMKYLFATTYQGEKK